MKIWQKTTLKISHFWWRCTKFSCFELKSLQWECRGNVAGYFTHICCVNYETAYFKEGRADYRSLAKPILPGTCIWSRSAMLITQLPSLVHYRPLASMTNVVRILNSGLKPGWKGSRFIWTAFSRKRRLETLSKPLDGPNYGSPPWPPNNPGIILDATTSGQTKGTENPVHFFTSCCLKFIPDLITRLVFLTTLLSKLDWEGGIFPVSQLKFVCSCENRSIYISIFVTFAHWAYPGQWQNWGSTCIVTVKLISANSGFLEGE